MPRAGPSSAQRAAVPTTRARRRAASPPVPIESAAPTSSVDDDELLCEGAETLLEMAYAPTMSLRSSAYSNAGASAPQTPRRRPPAQERLSTTTLSLLASNCDAVMSASRVRRASSALPSPSQRAASRATTASPSKRGAMSSRNSPLKPLAADSPLSDLGAEGKGYRDTPNGGASSSRPPFASPISQPPWAWSDQPQNDRGWLRSTVDASSPGLSPPSSSLTTIGDLTPLPLRQQNGSKQHEADALAQPSRRSLRSQISSTASTLSSLPSANPSSSLSSALPRPSLRLAGKGSTITSGQRSSPTRRRSSLSSQSELSAAPTSPVPAASSMPAKRTRNTADSTALPAIPRRPSSPTISTAPRSPDTKPPNTAKVPKKAKGKKRASTPKLVLPPPSTILADLDASGPLSGMPPPSSPSSPSLSSAPDSPDSYKSSAPRPKNPAKGKKAKSTPKLTLPAPSTVIPNLDTSTPATKGARKKSASGSVPKVTADPTPHAPLKNGKHKANKAKEPKKEPSPSEQFNWEEAAEWERRVRDEPMTEICLEPPPEHVDFDMFQLDDLRTSPISELSEPEVDVVQAVPKTPSKRKKPADAPTAQPKAKKSRKGKKREQESATPSTAKKSRRAKASKAAPAPPTASASATKHRQLSHEPPRVSAPALRPEFLSGQSPRSFKRAVDMERGMEMDKVMLSESEDEDVFTALEKIPMPSPPPKSRTPSLSPDRNTIFRPTELPFGVDIGSSCYVREGPCFFPAKLLNFKPGQVPRDRDIYYVEDRAGRKRFVGRNMLIFMTEKAIATCTLGKIVTAVEKFERPPRLPTPELDVPLRPDETFTDLDYTRQLVLVRHRLVSVIKEEYAPAQWRVDLFFGTNTQRQRLRTLIEYGDVLEAQSLEMTNELMRWVNRQPDLPGAKGPTRPVGSERFEELTKSERTDYVHYVLLPEALVAIAILVREEFLSSEDATPALEGEELLRVNEERRHDAVTNATGERVEADGASGSNMQASPTPPRANGAETGILPSSSQNPAIAPSVLHLPPDVSTELDDLTTDLAPAAQSQDPEFAAYAAAREHLRDLARTDEVKDWSKRLSDLKAARTAMRERLGLAPEENRESEYDRRMREMLWGEYGAGPRKRGRVSYAGMG